jgi:hypothetical protein
MTEEAENLILAHLRRLRVDVAALNGRLDDVVTEMRRISVLEGTASGLRHDVDVLTRRYHDHEARLRELEPDDLNGGGAA